MNYLYDFSIIIPAHNATLYINTALDSIIWQDYDFNKVEVIVVDDGSDDNLLDWIHGYVSKYKNIKYFRKDYGRWGSVINYIVQNKLVSGKYVTIMDPDDKLIFNCLKEISYAFKHEADILISDFYVWKIKKQKKKIVDKLRYQQTIFTIPNKKLIGRKNIEKARTPWGIPLGKFYRNELFYILPKLIEGIYYQDAVLFNNAINMAHVVVYIHQALGWWRNNYEGNLLSRKWDAQYCNEWLICIYNLIDANAKFIALMYMFKFKEFQQYLENKNIKIVLSKKIKAKWGPFGFRTLAKWFMLFNVKKYIKH